MSVEMVLGVIAIILALAAIWIANVPARGR